MKFQKYLFPFTLLIFVILIRLPGLSSFSAIDEPAWLTRGANFYYALGQRQFQNTIYEYHPSVTTMWFVAASTFVYFPESRGLGQGYFDVDKETFDPFLLAHGKTPLQLLFISRLFQVLMIALAVLVVYYFLSKMFGEGRAFFAAALVSSAPYFLGHSRVLSHEAQVSIYALTSILALMVYLEYERKWYFLVVSAVYAALAQLTKSSAMAMTPAVGLMFVLAVFDHMKEKGFAASLWAYLKIFFAWIFVLAITYVVIWPGMWVAPAKMLYEVYGNAFSYAFQGARLDVTQQLQPAQFKLASQSGTFVVFLRNLAWRATPVIWLGIILAIPFLFNKQKDKFSIAFKRSTIYLLIVAVVFIFLFSLVQGRNSAHYIMSSHVSVDLIAALGWCAFFAWLETKKIARINLIGAAGAIFLIALQILSALPFYPYYYTYNNPIMSALMRQNNISDYGEGFERAAAYLNQKPNAENLRALSFRGRGPFSFFFAGKTILLNPLFVEEPQMGSMVERLRESDYLVINDAFAPRTARTDFFVRELNKFVSPEQVIYIKDATAIRVYYVKDLPVAFYDAISK